VVLAQDHTSIACQHNACDGSRHVIHPEIHQDIEFFFVLFASCFVVQELLAIQQNGAKNIAFFGTRNMGFLHQQLVEILSYAMVLTGNHIFTSGGLGTNAAVIRGALRAERPDLLTVILPQSLEMQPEELHELLQQVEDLQCMSENDSMKLFDASRCDVVSAFMLHQLRCSEGPHTLAHQAVQDAHPCRWHTWH
jgi:hypothetical protein